jgi:hypothetical protein
MISPRAMSPMRSKSRIGVWKNDVDIRAAAKGVNKTHLSRNGFSASESENIRPFTATTSSAGKQKTACFRLLYEKPPRAVNRYGFIVLDTVYKIICLI